jgi:hypothetical protein
MALLMSLILGSGLAAFTSSNSASAQSYGYQNDYYGSGSSSYGGDDSYSKYPTDDKKYECRTGPFEGFFVSSVEFCKHIKFDDNKRDHKDRDRDNRTGTQGPPGPPGPPGPVGPAGPSTINTTNIYTNVGNTTSGTITTGFITSIALCDGGDTALSGSFDINGTAEIRIFEPLATENGWNATALVTGNAGGGGPNGSVTADVVCFDNPPPHIP